MCMNKRKLHHYWKKLRPIPPWVFLVSFIITASICVYALRQNNLGMIKLRDAVTAADRQNGDVETALRNLREYVYSHMNTALASGPNAIKPPIQLKYRYDRLVQAEKDRVSAINAKVYTDAQAYCEQQIPQGFSGRGRVPCIQDYVSKHGVQEQPIPDALYKFDFVAPFWSPDLAGWTLLASIALLLLFVARFSLELWLKHELHE